MNKFLIICGPTATGKTNLAVRIAKEYNGELVSADSRQVYTGLDIITGKDRPEGNIPIWLYDVVSPSEFFSVSQYQRLAQSAIDDIASRGKLPIIVGGTGLYIRSLVRPIETITVPQDETYRSKLAQMPVSQMQTLIQEQDGEKWTHMNDSDRANPRRLVRALEVSKWKKNHTIQARITPSYDILWIGLSSDMNMLKDKIRLRVISRIEGGAIDEVKKWPAISALGVRFILQYIDNKITKEELIDRWTHDEFLYAKRQMTWFKKEPAIQWFDIANLDVGQKVEEQVARWYTNGCQ